MTLFRRSFTLLLRDHVVTTPLRTCAAKPKTIQILGKSYPVDDWTNVNERIISKMDAMLHRNKNHPLGLINQRIINYMYSRYVSNTGNPKFAVIDNLCPVVTLQQNFDSLLVPKDHVSRSKSDSYYVNQNLMLRAHTSAHQSELISQGFDNFLVVGDVYRRDEIDSSHYPVFHQMEGVRLMTKDDMYKLGTLYSLKLFEAGVRTSYKQELHTDDAVRLTEFDLKNCLVWLAKDLFGNNIKYRWVECYFPFTHPSWELEIFYQGDWMEVLGCGIMEQEILTRAGVTDRMGWAFGLGLERLAMKLYQIPDIRLFWSKDSGFLNQFKVDHPNTPITYKEISKFPQCTNDISFWLPEKQKDIYSVNDFYDLVRTIGGDIVEQVQLIDEFHHPKKNKTSHCYRITYRHMEKTLTQEEVNAIHAVIEKKASEDLNVIIR